MASEIKVNTIKDLGGNTVLTSNGSGTISGLPASAISSGTVATARLGSGTASSSTFLAGDSSYKTVSGTTINNNADNRVITGSGTANTLEGEANLTFDGSTLACQGSAIFNESGADVDFRVEGDTDANMIFGDASSNNVGIGLATPMGKLHIRRASSGATGVQAASDELTLEGSGDSGMCILSGNNSSGIIHFGDDGNNQIGYIYYSHGTNSLGFGSNGATRATFDTDGRFFVNSSTVQQAALVNVAHGGNSVAGISFNDTDSASNATYASFIKGGTLIGNIRRNGSADAVNYNTSSDYRLKDGIVNKTDGIEKIKLLKPRKFYWKSDSDKTLVDGFLAHEVSDVVPEAISGVKDAVEKYKDGEELPEGKSVGDNKLDENGDTIIEPQGIDQSKIVPLLVASVQELITENETLKTRITALENA